MKVKQEALMMSDIRSELIRLVYSALPQSLVGVLINSFIIAVIQWEYISHTTIVLWFVCINSLSLIRFIAYLRFNKIDSNLPVPVFWERFAQLSSVVSGITWGAVVIWLFPADDVAHQVMLVFVLAGMCAGAVTTMSPMMGSLIAFVILAIFPAVVRFLYLGTDVAYAMAIMSVVFVVLILKTAMNLNRVLKQSLLMRDEQRHDKEIIQRQALYDSLTGLPNRRLLIEKIQQEVNRSLRHKNIGAVLFLDLDYFKSINDSMGHAVGDELLLQVANRLNSCLRKEDATARIGGDEFIILAANIGEDEAQANRNITIFTDKIRHQFDKEFYIDGQSIFITSSIGVTLFPIVDVSPEELLQKSDVAMYEAKAAGRNNARLFEPEMQQTIIKQRETEKGLRKALLEGELELYYQPLFDAEDNIFSVEALIRWNHPEKGMVPPVDFIGLAEKRGLIIPIGDWVLEQACKHLAEISGDSNISMSINVSPRQFSETSFVAKMIEVLTKTGVDPARVRLEITESMVMDNVEETIKKMQRLTGEGIHFSIDDFGTGYSSLAYLKRLPVDMLKIDKSFVLDITNDKDDELIVETILAMAHHMKIDVIAEGVETDQVLAFLKLKGCRKFQGYLFERPMPFADLIKRLNKSSESSAKLLSASDRQ